jgi:hypothetical protein
VGLGKVKLILRTALKKISVFSPLNSAQFSIEASAQCKFAVADADEEDEEDSSTGES